ncbi:recombination regulator RecX [Microbispora sp. NPDC049125]|uniref:recombination regulator RecX n=1 Tax=Microbispora sp. NPDC049125 TaxID=3154929 RepID=UPI003467BC60
MGPGDWASGPWGQADGDSPRAAAIDALREQIRSREAGRSAGAARRGAPFRAASSSAASVDAGSAGAPAFDVAAFDVGSSGGEPARTSGGRGTKGAGRRGAGGRRGRGRPTDEAQPFPDDGEGVDRDGLSREGVDRDGGRGREGGAGRGRGRRGGREGWLPDGPQEGSAASQGPDADPEAVARAICLRLLTMAPRTRAQLADALRKREVPEEVADAVLERFSDVGLIDDEAFAAAWVTSRHTGRGLARRALAQELRHRGVDEETVKEAVEQLDPDQEVETARALVARKLGATRGAEPQARTRRLVGMLARKGYPPGLAFRVVREALEAEGVDVDDLPEGST